MKFIEGFDHYDDEAESYSKKTVLELYELCFQKDQVLSGLAACELLEKISLDRLERRDLSGMNVEAREVIWDRIKKSFAL